MEEITRFVLLARSDRFTITELCEQYSAFAEGKTLIGISRKTGYKHLERFAAEGMKGLQARSHRPHHFPQRTDEAVEALVLSERRLHRTWGPKKLRRVLEVKHGVESPPVCSTIAEILRRHGLSVRRRRPPGVYPSADHGLTEPTQPNHVWTVDFKGWFILGDGQRCDPLTVTDLYSHFVVGVKAQPNQQIKGTRHAFHGLMRQAGQPQIIRVDHGTPFASIGLGRLSRLSVWWIQEGIEVEFTRPGKPQDNGSHERMHRDLKAEATQPPSANLAAQQRRFQRWQYTFNYERPHEALGMQFPADFYQPSPRRLGENDTPLVYPADCEVKVVCTSGFLAHEGHNYHVGEVFAGKPVGLRRNHQGVTEVHFANVHLGNLTLNGDDPWRPPAYVSPPPSPSACAPARHPSPAGPNPGGEADRLPVHPSAQSRQGSEPSPLP